MAEDKPRLARLAAIVTQLQSKRLLTAREIAERYQVSIRTVYRDIRTLEQSGVPIQTEEGRGYSIMEGYHLPPVMFTEEEALALVTAEQLINTNQDESLVQQYQNAITKIKSVLRHKQKAKTELLSDRLQVRANTKQAATSNYLIELQAAITNFQLVDLSYRSLAEEYTERTVEPFAIYTTQGNWILIAYCRKRQDFRAFRLDRIQQLQLTANTFDPHDLTLEEYLETCRRRYY